MDKPNSTAQLFRENLPAVDASAVGGGDRVLEHWTKRVVGFDDDGFALDAEGNRIEIVCAWCNGDGDECCNDTGFLFATRRDFEEWS